MRNLAIITARSGSKGLADKNIRDLNGKPLIAYTIETALESKCFDTVMVSTDSEKYAQIAREYGAEVPFLRSAENSSDTAGSWDVVDEVLHEYYKAEKVFDTVCLLQPTSPLREAEDIVYAYKQMDELNADAITSVCEAEHSSRVYCILPENKSLQKYRENNGFYLPRQADEPLYRINGALYIRRIGMCENDLTLHNKEYAYIMSKENSIDIDDKIDFALAEVMIREKSTNGKKESN